MEQNTTNNNTQFTISARTQELLTIFRNFSDIQCRMIDAFGDDTNGETVLDAAADTYREMQKAISHNIFMTLTNGDGTQI